MNIIEYNIIIIIEYNIIIEVYNMSETVKINICTDANTKKQVEEILSEIGLNMTAAINIYLKKILMEGGIPFELTTKTPNAATVAAMEEYEEMKKNPTAYKRYRSFKDAMDEVL